MFKLAIYTICKNEKENVEKYLNYTKKADYICILDTGSTDGTYELLQNFTAIPEYKDKLIINQKEYIPWRFDKSRNDNLDMIPQDADICWQLDMDESAEPNSIESIKVAWKPDTLQMDYKYVWREKPYTIFWYNKIHSRKDWTWLYPVHETLTYVGAGEIAAKTVRIDKILTVHHQLNKSRASYLPLLELRAAENMDGDIQGKIYLLHQYYFDCLYEKCIVYANKLELKDVESIYKADIQYYKGLALTQLKRKEDANDCFLLAEQFYPEWRDSYYQSALYYYFSGNYVRALKELLKMLNNTKRLYSWIEIGSAWTYRTYDLISICYFNLGNTYEAYNFSLIAKELCEKEDPGEDERNRIESNYKYFRETL